MDCLTCVRSSSIPTGSEENKASICAEYVLWPVWPDDGIKSGLIYYQRVPNNSHDCFYLNSYLFQKSPKVTRYLGYLFRTFVTSIFQKLPNLVVLTVTSKYFNCRVVMGSPQRTLASPKPNLQISKYHAVLQGRGGGQVGGGQVVCMLYSDNLNLNHI